MSKTVSYVLLQMLILARTIMSTYPISDSIQNISVSENNDSSFTMCHLDSVNMRNKIDEIPIANMSVIPESNENLLNRPTSPRAFVEFHNGFLNQETDISVTFRWDQPEFTDEIIQEYTVQCWFIENSKEIQICHDKNILAAILEHTVHNLKSNTTYYFQVRAHSKVGINPYTDLINVSTTLENPIPKLLTVSENGIEIWDLDLKSNVSLIEQNNVIDATYSMEEDKIYWSNDMRELMILDMNENNIIRIAKLQSIARHLCIDWIARNLYWMELDKLNFGDIIKLDLTLWENGIVKYDKISKIRTRHFTSLTILPSIGTLYWINYTMYNEPQVIQSDLDGKDAQKFQKNLSIVCPFSLNISYIVDAKIDDMDTKKPLIYWLMKDLLIVTDINISICNFILQAEKICYKLFFQSLTIDKTNIYISTFDNNYIYILKKKYALFKSVDAFKYIQMLKTSQIRKLYAFGKSLQSYPSTRCLTPDEKIYNAEELTYTVTTNSIIVNLPEPVLKSECKIHNLPTIRCTIYIWTYCLNNELNKFVNFTVQTYKRYYEIQNLLPFTKYNLRLAPSNFYSDRLSMDPLFGSEMILRTKLSKVDAPENVTVQALTPTTAAVFWMLPEKLKCIPVTYEVYWILINNTQQISDFLLVNEIKQRDSKFFTIIEPLKPGQKYAIYVRVYPADFSNHYNDSSSKTLYMHSEPNNIILRNVSTNSMDILWIPVSLAINYSLKYRNVKTQKWQIANNFKLIDMGDKIMYYIQNLSPENRYEFCLILKYPKYEKDFIWPSDGRFTFSTLTNKASYDNMGTYIFNIFYQYYKPYIISGLVIIVIMLVIIVICCILRRRCRRNQALPSIITGTELAILQEMPTSLHVQFNMSYNPLLQSDSDGYVLFKITHEQIKLEKLLGSGAFGLVYQGKVKNLDRTGMEIPVAIKMLGKNASSEEKKMFLEEARLMNYLRHKHVLRLLAVCLDSKSPSIVLELMEAGDLLQYLRDCRKLESSDSHALRLQDLIAMCEDVARGCRYLEYLRFVHRDLACRNCLVSARDRENRVVKIGDFGLTRDIYNSNYYRKKGEGLLPIRWMAPESLVYGKFTSQSEVWSFGVIMWEITSLGEHPYIGRTDLDVIHYVRNGYRLKMPLNCPLALYELMMRCWNPENDRPNFKLCLKNIIALRNNMEDTLLSPLDII